MQKLEERNTYTPTNASQVCGNCDYLLNKEETLSVSSLKTSSNNPDGNQPQHTEGSLKAKVYVLSKNDYPLMPTTPAKAKRMLKKGAAHVVKRTPFTIKLNFDCEEKTQSVTLTIDTGYGYIGISAVSEKEELLSAEVELDTRMKDRIDDKRMYRKNRRNKLWYRKKRFLNRKRKENWIPPSIARRYQTHLTLLHQIGRILPITNITVEVGKFDIQKINNPDISSTEYQQGNLYGYENTKAYLISREKGKCQFCYSEYKKGDPWKTHHIIPRSKGGTDRVDNLALIHKSCHKKMHRGQLENTLKKSKQFKDATFMNIVRKRFKQDVDCTITYGAYTYIKRNALGLKKSHINDAFAISGTNQIRCKPFTVIQKRSNNRCLQKNRPASKKTNGRSIRRKRYSLQPKDLVKVTGKLYEVKGVHSYGNQVKLVDKMGNVINKAIKKLDDSYVYHSKTLQWRSIFKTSVSKG